MTEQAIATRRAQGWIIEGSYAYVAADLAMRGDLFSQWLVVGFVGSRFENRLDGLAEELANAEGERQTGIVFAGFDGVHSLARNFEPVGQFPLGPFTLGAENAKTILHRALTRIRWPQCLRASN
jgi:hypothetical protein